MPFQQIDQISAYLAGTGITVLELTGPDGTVRLTNRPAAAVPDIEIPSPAAGRFLHAHPLARSPLAPAGAQVAPGAVVGLLRVGVLLLPVTAPACGSVAAHQVEDGAIAGFGAVLMTLHSIEEAATP